ncbi:MAG: hypothetical protein Q8O26_03270 [Phreatobacter sp.]|uniref:hypothetical protein n=1 Tax=Phreatobacter sp. TaxID=1966341 RepID=UPI0027356955|nr:hypothetical protein [Phreatobacter sp.]MDP2800880.1 hypothetical protein [Phreatobacter sp.]
MEAISAECGMIHESDLTGRRQERCRRAGTAGAGEQRGNRALHQEVRMKISFVLLHIENNYRLYFRKAALEE